MFLLRLLNSNKRHVFSTQWRRERLAKFWRKEGRLRDICTLNWERGKGVKNPKNLAGLICKWPLANASLIQDLKMWEDLNMTNKRRMGSNRATSVPSNTRLLIPNLSVHLLCVDARLLPDSMATKRWVRQWLRPRQKKDSIVGRKRPQCLALEWSTMLSRAVFKKMRGNTCPTYILRLSAVYIP